MPESPLFLSGVIEGFYGRPWPLETRLAYADYLQDAGLNTCLYAPKADAILRRQWQDLWPDAQWRELHQVAAAYRERGIQWGVGLSPFELYLDYGPAQKEALRRKIGHIGELEAPVLAVLFDDMPGDMDGLANRQAEIVNDICQWAPGARVLVCPTYYSYDPVLEKYFGDMPLDYWPQLGRALPQQVDIFWTGNKVCSEAISHADIASITGQLGRPVILWDNYPVNDGPKRSKFLYLKALQDRESSLRPLLSGHLCNPMNQGMLSLPALSGLARLYGSGEFCDETLSRMLGARTWERLCQDSEVFELQGLSGLGEERCRQLAAEYATLPGDAATEAAQWLRGEYTFDPACLTD